MKIKRLVCLALAALVCTASVSGCNGGDAASQAGSSSNGSSTASAPEGTSSGNNDSTFTAWLYSLSASPTGEYVEYLKAFKDKYPELNAEITIMSGEDIKTQARLAVESGTAPDAMITNAGDDFWEFVDKDAAMDLTDIIKENNFDKFADKAYFDTFTRDGKTYGMPIGGVTVWQTLYVNNDIFKANNLEYPKTIEELQEVSKKLHDAGIEPLAVGDKDGWPALLLLGDLYLQQTGYDSVNQLNSGEVKFADDPYMKKALESLASMGSSNVFMSGFASSDQTEAIQSWAAGQVAMLYNGSWWTGTAGGTDLGFEIVPVKLPMVEGLNDINTVQMACDNGLFFNPNCTNKDAIVKFIDYMCNEEAQVLYCTESNVFSIYPGANEKVTLDPIFTQPAILDQFDYKISGVFFDHAFPSAVIAVMKTAVQNVVTGQATVEDALQQIDAEMAKNRTK